MSTPDFEKQPPPAAPPQQPAPPYAGQQPPATQQPPYAQPPPQQPGPPLPMGQPPPLRPDEEKTWGILAHAGGFLLGVLAPLIVWLMYRERSAWINDTAKEALNFQISYLVYFFVAAMSLFLLVGIVLLPVVWVAYYVFMIIASIKAANLEPYRYPLIFRLVT